MTLVERLPNNAVEEQLDPRFSLFPKTQAPRSQFFTQDADRLGAYPMDVQQFVFRLTDQLRVPGEAVHCQLSTGDVAYRWWELCLFGRHKDGFGLRRPGAIVPGG